MKKLHLLIVMLVSMCITNASDPIQIFSKKELTQEVENSNMPVVIKVYATWCNPCQHMTPIFYDLCNDNDDIKFVEINIDSSSSLTRKLGVKSIPIFLFYKDGTEVSRLLGSQSKTKLQSECDKLTS